MATAITYENLNRCATEIERYFKDRGYDKNKKKRLTSTEWRIKTIYIHPSFFTGECMLNSGKVIYVGKDHDWDMHRNWNGNKLKWEVHFLEHIQPIVLKYNLTGDNISFFYSNSI